MFVGIKIKHDSYKTFIKLKMINQKKKSTNQTFVSKEKAYPTLFETPEEWSGKHKETFRQLVWFIKCKSQIYSCLIFSANLQIPYLVCHAVAIFSPSYWPMLLCVMGQMSRASHFQKEGSQDSKVGANRRRVSTGSWFQNISTWLMEDVNKQKRTNLDTLHWKITFYTGFNFASQLAFRSINNRLSSVQLGAFWVHVYMKS